LVGFQALVAGSLGSSAGAGAGGQAVAQGKAAAAATHAAATTKTAGLLGSAGAKLALAAVGTAAVVAASVATWPAAHNATPSEPRRVATSSTAPSESPQPLVVDALATKTPAMEPKDTSAPAAAPTHRVAQTRVALAPGAAPVQANLDDAMRREIAQLAQIKAALDTDPARAYRLAQAGHHEFGRGMLRQEREALAVLSLWQLGRRTEATGRARVFLARYPQSPLRESIERLLHPEIE
jgi:hypothetical protein